jgi:signal peptidase II
MNFKNPRVIIGIMLIIDFIIFDQLTKWLILEYVLRPELNQAPLGPIEWFKNSDRLPFISVGVISNFNLTMVWNQGVSFGMFQSGNPWPLIIVALIIAGVFSVWLVKSQNWFETIALSMVIGGALGNVIDRLHFGAVADFFDFYIGDWHYPAFNIADSLISIGVVLLIIYSFFFSNDKNKQTSEVPS